jgi:hypothetical protein
VSDEIERLKRATNESLETPYAFQDTPAGTYAKYCLRRWRDLALQNPIIIRQDALNSDERIVLVVAAQILFGYHVEMSSEERSRYGSKVLDILDRTFE